MNKSKKICLIIPTLQAGGMERVMSELANFLSKRDHFVSIILMTEKQPFFTLDKKITLIQPKKVFKNNLYDALRLFYFIRQTVKKINPDTVLSFGERYNSYVLLSLIGKRVPVFISDRSSPNKKLSKFYILLSRILYIRSSGIIAQTTLAAKMLNSRLGSNCPKVEIIPNPIRNVTTSSISFKRDQIVAVGRLVKEKRYDRLLEIMSKIENHLWKLIIVGEGSLRQELEEKISNLGIGNRIELLGQQYDVDHFYNESKIFVLTSDSEGFPNALCDAMAHGLACISFDCIAGPSDIIENNKNGIIIEDGNINDFAETLNRLTNDEYLREYLGENAKSIQNTFEMNKVFGLYESFILSKN